MVGGTTPPQSDSGEISRVLVLNLLWQSKRCSRTAQDISVLTTPSLLSRAIYYEHKACDPEQAQEVVRRALDELRRANQTGNIAPGVYREIKVKFEHRMTRLERKSRRPLLDVLGTRLETQW